MFLQGRDQTPQSATNLDRHWAGNELSWNGKVLHKRHQLRACLQSAPGSVLQSGSVRISGVHSVRTRFNGAGTTCLNGVENICFRGLGTSCVGGDDDGTRYIVYSQIFMVKEPDVYVM